MFLGLLLGSLWASKIDKNQLKFDFQKRLVFSFVFFTIMNDLGYHFWSKLVNFLDQVRGCSKKGRHAFRLRRRSRIEGRASRNPSKIDTESIQTRTPKPTTPKVTKKLALGPLSTPKSTPNHPKSLPKTRRRNGAKNGAQESIANQRKPNPIGVQNFVPRYPIISTSIYIYIYIYIKMSLVALIYV